MNTESRRLMVDWEGDDAGRLASIAVGAGDDMDGWGLSWDCVEKAVCRGDENLVRRGVQFNAAEEHFRSPGWEKDAALLELAHRSSAD
jgi:hypothetical protein